MSQPSEPTLRTFFINIRESLMDDTPEGFDEFAGRALTLAEQYATGTSEVSPNMP